VHSSQLHTLNFSMVQSNDNPTTSVVFNQFQRVESVWYDITMHAMGKDDHRD